MINDVERILFTQEELSRRVGELGAQISRDYEGKNLLLISVLKGSVVLMADLMRSITIPCQIDFLAVSSYGSGTRTSGEVKMLKDLDHPIDGMDILIVEDILDSGVTPQLYQGDAADQGSGQYPDLYSAGQTGTAQSPHPGGLCGL